jgi:hypothetical protein
MLRALLDRSAEDYCRVFEQASMALPNYTNRLAGIISRRKRPEPFVSEQRGALLEISRAVHSGNAELFTSRIGHDEAFRVARFPDMASSLDILHAVGVQLKWIDLPFDFAKLPFFYNKPGEIYRDTLAAVLRPDFIAMLLSSPERWQLTSAEVENLKTAQLVCRISGPRREHVLDVFQLWTASVAKIPYFLTCDKKFIRYMSSTHRNPFSAKPILPSDLSIEAKIAFRPLLPPHDDDFFTHPEAPMMELIAAYDRGEPPPRAYQDRSGRPT